MQILHENRSYSINLEAESDNLPGCSFDIACSKSEYVAFVQDSVNPQKFTAFINNLSNANVLTIFSYTITDASNNTNTRQEYVILRSMSGEGNGNTDDYFGMEDSIYHDLLTFNPYIDCYYNKLLTNELIVIQGSVTYNNNYSRYDITNTGAQIAIIETPNIMLSETLNLDKFLFYMVAGDNLPLAEYSIDDGIIWNTIDHANTMETVTFSNIKIRFTFSIDTTLDSFGILSNFFQA